MGNGTKDLGAGNIVDAGKRLGAWKESTGNISPVAVAVREVCSCLNAALITPDAFQSAAVVIAGLASARDLGVDKAALHVLVDAIYQQGPTRGVIVIPSKFQA